jgi:hypothetical protein
MPVWQRAAAAAADGLDADAAITSTARQLAQRPTHDPTDSHRYAATALSTLDQQRADGRGWQPALPWLARPDHTALSADLTEHLQRLETRISARATELRAQVTANPPHWTAALSARPDETVSAERWDTVAGLAAAYRDTYDITTNDPQHPLGDEPDGHGLNARAWHQLIDQWTPEPHAETHQDPGVDETALDRLRAEFEDDELMSALAGNETVSTTGEEEPLSVLAERHDRASRALLDQLAHQALTQHAPQTLDQPGQPRCCTPCAEPKTSAGKPNASSTKQSTVAPSTTSPTAPRCCTGASSNTSPTATHPPAWPTPHRSKSPGGRP